MQLGIPQPIVKEEGAEPEMPPPIDYSTFDEKCLVRVMNHSEAEAAAQVSRQDPSRASAQAAEVEHDSQADAQSATSSQREQRRIENFELEKMAPKIILLRR